jgi:hypothetical protein
VDSRGLSTAPPVDSRGRSAEPIDSNSAQGRQGEVLMFSPPRRRGSVTGGEEAVEGAGAGQSVSKDVRRVSEDVRYDTHSRPAGMLFVLSL